MSTRLAAHLRRNRHDVFYFRQAVPADLVPLFATREIYKTLATRDRLEARQRALVIAIKIDALFRNLRLMSKKKPANVVRADLKVILDFDPLKGLTQATVHAEPNEEQMADRLVPRLLHAARGTAPTESGGPVLAEVRLTELIERYCHEQTQWKSQSRDDIRGDLLQIAAIAGDPLSAQLSRPMLSEAQATLLKLPSNVNKLPVFADKSFDEIIAYTSCG